MILFKVLVVLLFLIPSLTFAGSSLTSKGNEIKYNVTEGFVRERPLTAFGDLRVAELSPVFQGTFEYTVGNTALSVNTIANSGTVTQADAMAVIGTGTTTGSTSLLQSKQQARYHAGLGGLVRFTALFTTPVTGTEQYFGLADEVGSSAAFKNGYMIGYDGTTFGFHRFQNDVKFTIPLANWDDPLDGTGMSNMTIDQTNLNVFFIDFEYLGAGGITVWIANDSSPDMIPVHTLNYSNNNTVPSVYNPNFFYTIWTANKGTTSDIVAMGASYAYFVEGKTDLIELHRPVFGSGQQQKTTVTTEVAIFTIRNKTTYASKKNFVPVLVAEVFASIEASSANNLGIIRFVKNATLGGSPSYSSINATDSVMEIDIAGTTVTGGIELFSIPLAGKNDKGSLDLSLQQIILNPGESITLAGSSVNSATINAGTSWKELF